MIKSFHIKLSLMLFFTTIISMPTIAFAATNGSLGATSTGTSVISVTKSVQAQITDLSNMTLSNWSIGQGEFYFIL